MSKDIPSGKSVENILAMLDISGAKTLGDIRDTSVPGNKTGERIRLFAGRLATPPRNEMPETADMANDNDATEREKELRSLGGLPLGSSATEWDEHFTALELAALEGRAPIKQALDGTVVFHQGKTVEGTDPFDDIAWVNQQ